MPKFKKTATELTTIVDQWVFFIKNAENLEVIPDNVNDEGLKFAYQDADKHNWTKEELEAYDYVLMREQDERGRISFATKKATEIATKIATEIATKIATNNTLVHVAKNLLTLGLPLADIEKSTGLTIEQIQELQSGE